MRKSWLLCVFLGALAWGQAQPETPPVQSNPATPPGAAAKAPAPAAEVPENAVVLTIKGVCAPVAKTPAAGAKTAAGKTAAAKKPADCKTEITRAQFEKIANGLSPNVTPQLKRQLETALPRFMAMSEIATEKGLDKTPRFQEMMKIVKMQVLTQELQRSAQEQSDKVTPDEVDKYYKENAQAFQQYSLDRLFVPRFKQAEPDSKPEGQLSDDERKKKEADDKAKQEQSEQDLTKLADTLRARAASGEDFTKLQKEAFEAAGEKVDNPTVNLPKVRRTGLPPAHAVVFDLKVGEVSQVISDNGGHYVYKVVSEEVLPLDHQVTDEIHNKLKSESMKAVMDKYNGSFEAIPNEAYFGPPQAPGMHGAPGPHMPHPGRAPIPGSAPPPQTNPQSQPPASQPPPSN
jgi:hypothetical protein